METFTYPPMPVGADKNILKPSKAFSRQVYKSIGAIALFVFTYLFLFCGALVIAVGFGYAGIQILSAGSALAAYIAGFGLIIAGALLVFFLIKFLFKENKTDYSGMVEINEQEQPLLYEFINNVAVETQAPKPKCIYISADVNAGVFYTSSFWSMFFPVRKNLKIGLGLVNAVNISEFKAIMAHEFGHFSQRSMKFGSYFYNLNRVIFNMLYENSGYEKILSTWARMHAIFGLIAWLNIYIIRGIQAILKQVYVIVNKTYMALSREMEFHADSVAAFVAGSNQMVTALRRVELAALSYSNLLGFWEVKLKEQKRSVNFYPQQSEVLKFYAGKRNLPVDALGLPKIDHDIINIGDNQVSIDNQWSSHPSNKDRETYLQNINIDTIAVNEPAWSLFKNREQLQVALTNLMYATTNVTAKTAEVGFEDFKKDFSNAVNTHKYDAVFKDYYDDRLFTPFNIPETIILAATIKPAAFEELLNDNTCNLPVLVRRLKQDIDLLDIAADKKKDVKTFDYKGIKYFRKDAVEVRAILKKEYSNAEQQLNDLDKNLFIYFYNNSGGDGQHKELLTNMYTNLFKYEAVAVKDFHLYNEIMQVMRPVYTKLQPSKIGRTLKEVYIREPAIKSRIKEIVGDSTIIPFLTDEQLKNLKDYLSDEWIYYFNPGYNEYGITVFNKAMLAYQAIMSKVTTAVKKDLLDCQAGLLRSN